MTTQGGPAADPKKPLPAVDRPLPRKAKKPKPRKVEKGRRRNK
jgi:hypothetical protein